MMDGTVTIHLVEDNEVDMEAVSRASRLQEIGNPIVVVGDGIEGMRKLREGEVPEPRIVLRDLNMPRMNGLALVEELRSVSEAAATIVRVLTTSSGDEDQMGTYANEVAGYLVKNKVGPQFVELPTILDPSWHVVERPPEPR